VSSIVPATDARIVDVRKTLGQLEDRISTLAAGSLDPTRFVAIVTQAVQKTPKLLECDRLSLLSSVLEAASLGLTPSGITGEAYLVPRKGVANLQIGYRGLAKLALETGAVRQIVARPVYEADFFKYGFGLEADLFEHVPSEEEDPGGVVRAYAIARMTEGPAQLEVTSRRDIERARAVATTDAVWSSHYPEMAAKTAVRRLCKLLVLTPRFARALAIEDGELRPGEAIDLGISVSDQPIEVAPQRSKADRTADRFRKTPIEEPAPDPEVPEPDPFEVEVVGQEEAEAALDDADLPWAATSDDAPRSLAETEDESPQPRRAGRVTLTKLEDAVTRAGIDDSTLRILVQQAGAKRPEDLSLAEANELVRKIESGDWKTEVPF
jgi:recombination protein RecT